MAVVVVVELGTEDEAQSSVCVHKWMKADGSLSRARQCKGREGTGETT